MHNISSTNPCISQELTQTAPRKAAGHFIALQNGAKVKSGEHFCCNHIHFVCGQRHMTTYSYHLLLFSHSREDPLGVAMETWSQHLPKLEAPILRISCAFN